MSEYLPSKVHTHNGIAFQQRADIGLQHKSIQDRKGRFGDTTRVNLGISNPMGHRQNSCFGFCTQPAKKKRVMNSPVKHR